MKKKAIALLLVVGIIVSSAFSIYADDTTVFSEYETEEVENATQDEAEQDHQNTSVTEETENAEEEVLDDTNAPDSIPEEEMSITETPDVSEKVDEVGEPGTASDDSTLLRERQNSDHIPAVDRNGNSVLHKRHLTRSGVSSSTLSRPSGVLSGSVPASTLSGSVPETTWSSTPRMRATRRKFSRLPFPSLSTARTVGADRLARCARRSTVIRCWRRARSRLRAMSRMARATGMGVFPDM